MVVAERVQADGGDGHQSKGEFPSLRCFHGQCAEGLVQPGLSLHFDAAGVLQPVNWAVADSLPRDRPEGRQCSAAPRRVGWGGDERDAQLGLSASKGAPGGLS